MATARQTLVVLRGSRDIWDEDVNKPRRQGRSCLGELLGRGAHRRRHSDSELSHGGNCRVLISLAYQWPKCFQVLAMVTKSTLMIPNLLE